MNFELTDEQRILQETARRFVAEHAVHRGAAARSYSGAAWGDLASTGFLTLACPPEHGGYGNETDLALACRELGRGPLTEPFVECAVFASQLIVAAGTTRQQSELLPPLGRGEIKSAVAYREPGQIERIGIPGAAVTRTAHGYRLQGRKCLVMGGDAADTLIVSALWPQEAGASLLVLEADRPGIARTPLPLLNGGYCADITFTDVAVSEADLLGGTGVGTEALRLAMRYAMLGICSEVAGVCAQALAQTVDFVRERKQFGGPLSALQVVRAKLSDMAIQSEMAWSAVCALLAALKSAIPEHADMAAVMAKFAVDDLGRRVCNTAIQLHGGMGLTTECGIGRFLQQASVARSLYGSPEALLNEYSTKLHEQLAVQA